MTPDPPSMITPNSTMSLSPRKLFSTSRQTMIVATAMAIVRMVGATIARHLRLRDQSHAVNAMNAPDAMTARPPTNSSVG
jgi:hypothetical protein